jgi:hypothetical protein
MLRFLPGIILIQLATVALVFLAPDNLQGAAWLRLLIPILVVGFFAAFWFAAIAKHKSKDDVAMLKAEHAREREKIQINAERAKTRIVKKTQQQISRETKIAHGKANFKVGVALAGVMGLGALMLLTQFLTLGVFTLTTAGGALGGYLYRGRKERHNNLLADQQNTQLNKQQSLTQANAPPPKLIPADRAKK